MPVLPYGIDSTLSLDLPESTRLEHCAAPRGKSDDVLRQSVQQVLAEPLEYPPLAQVALPGDRVVLALAREVPQASLIVAQTIEALLAGGTEAGNIAVVCESSEVDEDALLAELAPEVRQAVSVQAHDPELREGLSYLAADAEARPIYINRTLYDAEVVIPIGVLRLTDALAYAGIHSSVFPAFSDAESLERFRAPKAAREGEQGRLRKQADEVGWLLGTQFTIQVVPAAAGGVLHVLAGLPEAVLREGSRRCEQAWSFGVPERAALVVATVVGDAAQQTWENVGRALASAARVLEDDGSVIVCTQLDRPIGPAMARLMDADDLHAAERRIVRERSSDALAARELVLALNRAKVYLLSRLDDDLVERLGMLPVDAAGAARLAGRATSCIVLSSAQYAVAHPESEAALGSGSGGSSHR
ncbi:MAG: DUF2088 domain-containing protein [Planctomycetota bacterium]|nr:MAG: DUF2088 domain-containing protein [Planctomycetota bacterium]